jgi:hypothetical protein
MIPDKFRLKGKSEIVPRGGVNAVARGWFISELTEALQMDKGR